MLPYMIQLLEYSILYTYNALKQLCSRLNTEITVVNAVEKKKI